MSASVQPLDRNLFIHAGVWMYAAGALLSAVTLPLPHSQEVDEVGFVVLTLVTALVALGLALFGRRVPDAGLPFIPAVGTVIVTLAIAFSAEVTDNEILYLFPTMLASVFLSGRAAAANGALIGACYAVHLALVDAPDALPRWAATVASLSLAGFVIGSLRRRMDDAIAEQARYARTDPLTGLANRRAFDEALEAEKRRSARSARPFSLLVADLDYFKAVNDRLGHAAGDVVLQQAASVLESATRSIDFTARLGGEEFAVLAPETNARAALVTAERLRRAVEEGLAAGDAPLTMSVGIATMPEDGTDAEALMAVADERLYRAKAEGRNRAVGA